MEVNIETGMTAAARSYGLRGTLRNDTMSFVCIRSVVSGEFTCMIVPSSII